MEEVAGGRWSWRPGLQPDEQGPPKPEREGK